MQLPLPGRHNVSNALAAAALAVALGVSMDQIRRGLGRVKPVAGRMQVLPGVRGSVVIHDAYNANPKSLQAALEVLSELDGSPWLVLGDFAELGPDSDAIHASLGETIYQSGIQRLLATGPGMQAAVARFQACAAEADNPAAMAEHFPDKVAMSQRLQQTLQAGQVVLVKGSRSQRMEQVVEAITQKEPGACC